MNNSPTTATPAEASKKSWKPSVVTRAVSSCDRTVPAAEWAIAHNPEIERSQRTHDTRV